MNKYFKYIIGILIITILMGGIIICREQVYLEKSDISIDTSENVRMFVAEATVTPKGMTYYLESNSNDMISYGADYILEVQQKEGWYKVPLLGEGIEVIAVEYNFLRPEVRVYSVDWSRAYGTLEPGNYRLVKAMRNESKIFYEAAEFTIERE